jgi:hypothetical protein
MPTSAPGEQATLSHYCDYLQQFLIGAPGNWQAAVVDDRMTRP